MKLIAVRYFFNEKKGIFFYTADGRIDFRQLVKDLAKELRMRIEMRQVGVRDEAKIIGGLGVCGRPLCCASFMKDVRARDHPEGAQAADRHQPDQDLRPVRPADVLSGVRGGDDRGRLPAGRQRRQIED